MGSEFEDRRIRRTRELLDDALVALIMEKGFEATTVQDIIDRAGVARSTFYAHYRNKDELLLGSHGEAMTGLGQGTRADDTLSLFGHAASYRRLYKAMVGERSGNMLLARAHDQFRARERERLESRAADAGSSPPDAGVPVEVAAQFVASSLLGLLTWWLDNDVPYPPERMNAMFEALTERGLRAALSEEGD